MLRPHDPLNPVSPPPQRRWDKEDVTSAAAPPAEARIDFRYWLAAVVIGIAMWALIWFAIFR